MIKITETILNKNYFSNVKSSSYCQMLIYQMKI